MTDSSLPFISHDLPGIAGKIKAEPAHFVVEEIPLYEPCGEGDHLYVCLTREGEPTKSIETTLGSLFGLGERDIGCAGLKDKQARATQTFSLNLRDKSESEVADRIRQVCPYELHWVRRHRNKLKPGHLLGNRFRIVVLGTEDGAMEQAEVVADFLKTHHIPNFYGAQRFGVDGQNAERGREILLGKGQRKRWQRRFLLSAYQSFLFNLWLIERIRRGWFDVLVAGDIAKKTDTGGLFLVENLDEERPRFGRGELTYTGPMYGAKMRWAEDDAGELERAILTEAEVTDEMLRRAKVSGSRRTARLSLDDLKIEPHPDGLLFSFFLPKGAYATTVLREFMKSETSLPED